MNSSPAFPMPELTAFDAVTHLISVAVYVAIGVAGLAQAPRDERTRVFAALAAAHAVGFLIPVFGWFVGVKDPFVFDRVPLGVTLSALSLAALLMFHFSQVFPRRRPWIRGAGMQLPIAYALTPIVVFMLVRTWPLSVDSVSPTFGIMFIVFGFPLMALLGLVLPIAAIVSFVRSLREAVPRAGGAAEARIDAGTGMAAARVPLTGILLSQFGGAILSIVVLAPLTALAPESFAVAVVGLTVWLFGMLTPLSYAAGIWKYRVLEIRLPEMQPD